MVRRAYEKTRNLPPWLMNREYGRKRVPPLKIKLILPAQETVTIKKKRTTCKNDKRTEEI